MAKESKKAKQVNRKQTNDKLKKVSSAKKDRPQVNHRKKEQSFVISDKNKRALKSDVKGKIAKKIFRKTVIKSDISNDLKRNLLVDYRDDPLRGIDEITRIISQNSSSYRGDGAFKNGTDFSIPNDAGTTMGRFKTKVQKKYIRDTDAYEENVINGRTENYMTTEFQRNMAGSIINYKDVEFERAAETSNQKFYDENDSSTKFKKPKKRKKTSKSKRQTGVSVNAPKPKTSFIEFDNSLGTDITDNDTGETTAERKFKKVGDRTNFVSNSQNIPLSKDSRTPVDGNFVSVNKQTTYSPEEFVIEEQGEYIVPDEVLEFDDAMNLEVSDQEYTNFVNVANVKKDVITNTEEIKLLKKKLEKERNKFEKEKERLIEENAKAKKKQDDNKINNSELDYINAEIEMMKEMLGIRETQPQSEQPQQQYGPQQFEQQQYGPQQFEQQQYGPQQFEQQQYGPQQFEQPQQQYGPQQFEQQQYGPQQFEQQQYGPQQFEQQQYGPQQSEQPQQQYGPQQSEQPQQQYGPQQFEQQQYGPQQYEQSYRHNSMSMHTPQNHREFNNVQGPIEERVIYNTSGHNYGYDNTKSANEFRDNIFSKQFTSVTKVTKVKSDNNKRYKKY